MDEKTLKTGFAMALIGAAALTVGCDRNEQRAMAEERAREQSKRVLEDQEQDRERSREIEQRYGDDKGKEPSPAAAGALGGALQSLTDARCAREERCNNVGPGEDFESRDACTSSLRNKVAEDLSATSCPGGVDQKELDECLAEIRNDSCNSPLDAIGRIAACRTGDLCKATR